MIYVLNIYFTCDFYKNVNLYIFRNFGLFFMFYEVIMFNRQMLYNQLNISIIVVFLYTKL